MEMDQIVHAQGDVEEGGRVDKELRLVEAKAELQQLQCLEQLACLLVEALETQPAPLEDGGRGGPEVEASHQTLHRPILAIERRHLRQCQLLS